MCNEALSEVQSWENQECKEGQMNVTELKRQNTRKSLSNAQLDSDAWFAQLDSDAWLYMSHYTTSWLPFHLYLQNPWSKIF